MFDEIRVYFEGHRLLKSGLDAFFRELKDSARKQRRGFRLISAKSGKQARQDFEIALKANTDSWSILLIDSEGPLARTSDGSRADSIFWMVEMMEAWFHADPSALAEFHGPGFQKSSLKANPKVEEIPKQDLEKGLRAPTNKTAKGDYFDNKTSHGPKLLALIDPALVREAAPNCDRLFRAILTHLH
jgi:hypothetical protein